VAPYTYSVYPYSSIRVLSDVNMKTVALKWFHSAEKKNRKTRCGGSILTCQNPMPLVGLLLCYKMVATLCVVWSLGLELW